MRTCHQCIHEGKEGEIMIIGKRWNLAADDAGIVVCRDTHEKGEPCEAHQERISHKEVLSMLEELQRNTKITRTQN